MHLDAQLSSKKSYAILFAAIGTTLGNTLFYLVSDIFEFIDKRSPIDLVEHVPCLFFAIQNPGLMHQIQMPGDNRSILG